MRVRRPVLHDLARDGWGSFRLVVCMLLIVASSGVAVLGSIVWTQIGPEDNQGPIPITNQFTVLTLVGIIGFVSCVGWLADMRLRSFWWALRTAGASAMLFWGIIGFSFFLVWIGSTHGV